MILNDTYPTIVCIYPEKVLLEYLTPNGILRVDVDLNLNATHASFKINYQIHPIEWHGILARWTSRSEAIDLNLLTYIYVKYGYYLYNVFYTADEKSVTFMHPVNNYCKLISKNKNISINSLVYMMELERVNSTRVI